MTLKVKSSNGMTGQGSDNPGYTPLQNSGQGGKGYAANLQPTSNQGLSGAITKRMYGKKLTKKAS